MESDMLSWTVQLQQKMLPFLREGSGFVSGLVVGTVITTKIEGWFICVSCRTAAAAAVRQLTQKHLRFILVSIAVPMPIGWRTLTLCAGMAGQYFQRRWRP